VNAPTVRKTANEDDVDDNSAVVAIIVAAVEARRVRAPGVGLIIGG